MPIIDQVVSVIFFVILIVVILVIFWPDDQDVEPCPEDEDDVNDDGICNWCSGTNDVFLVNWRAEISQPFEDDRQNELCANCRRDMPRGAWKRVRHE